jgi:hypothetical protein
MSGSVAISGIVLPRHLTPPISHGGAPGTGVGSAKPRTSSTMLRGSKSLPLPTGNKMQ